MHKTNMGLWGGFQQFSFYYRAKVAIIEVIVIVLASLIDSACFAQWSSSGTEIYNTNSGYVGIGASSPSAKLHVVTTAGTVGDFIGYPGYSTANIWPNGIVPEALFYHPNTGTSTGGQNTYRGGIGLGYGVGIYSVNPNPAGSLYYGDIRFHTTYWNGSAYVNADRMIIDLSGNVGIGTTNPAAKLHVVGNSYLIDAGSSIYGNNDAANYSLEDAGTGFLKIKWYGGVGILTNNTERMRVTANGNIGIGTTAPSEKLSVNGNVAAKKVIVTQTGWSDYVFHDRYKLRSMAELSDYIQKHKHLPEVPSTEEVEMEGVNLGDNQALLLKKIEELTLYVLQLEKKSQAHDRKIRECEKYHIAFRRKNEINK